MSNKPNKLKEIHLTNPPDDPEDAVEIETAGIIMIAFKNIIKLLEIFINKSRPCDRIKITLNEEKKTLNVIGQPKSLCSLVSLIVNSLKSLPLLRYYQITFDIYTLIL